MTISQVAKYGAARAMLACSIVFMATCGAWACEPEQPTKDEKQEIQKPPFQVRLLFVQRDWSDDQQIQRDVSDALQQRDGEQNGGDGESAGTNVNVFLPEAGHAAVFEPQQFANLTQWLRERKLLLSDQSIPFEATRFDGRWTGLIQPSWGGKRARPHEDWHLEVAMVETEVPDMAARIHVQRSQARRSPPGGPRLRGSALDSLKKISFYLPKDRTVVMQWHAHPEDPRRNQEALEPILVFEVSDSDDDQGANAQFHLPERVIDLLLE